jgi:hypothetical protein
MFRWSWSAVKVTGGGAVETVGALWASVAAAQMEESERAKNFSGNCTLTFLGWYSGCALTKRFT